MAANSLPPPPSSHENTSNIDNPIAASPPPTLSDVQGLLEEAHKAYEKEDMNKLLLILLQSIAAFSPAIALIAPIIASIANGTQKTAVWTKTPPKTLRLQRPFIYAKTAAGTPAPKPVLTKTLRETIINPKNETQTQRARSG